MQRPFSKNQIFLAKYRIRKPIGSGGFGDVFWAQNTKTKQHVAIKVDNRKSGFLQHEFNILKILQPGKGITKIYECGNYKQISYLIIQLLDKSLDQIQKSRGGTLIPSKVCQIAKQGLQRLQYIHEKGILHLDIKPSQFVYGGEVLYLIDFGLSNFYLDHGQHYQFKENCTRIGTILFSSINNHMRFRQSRRDDLESFIYTLCFLANGKLPWGINKGIARKNQWDDVLSQKLEVRPGQLFKGMPVEMVQLYSYCRSLEFDQPPDYLYMRRLVKAYWQYSKSKQKMSCIGVSKSYNTSLLNIQDQEDRDENIYEEFKGKSRSIIISPHNVVPAQKESRQRYMKGRSTSKNSSLNFKAKRGVSYSNLTTNQRYHNKKSESCLNSFLSIKQSAVDQASYDSAIIANFNYIQPNQQLSIDGHKTILCKLPEIIDRAGFMRKCIICKRLIWYNFYKNEGVLQITTEREICFENLGSVQRLYSTKRILSCKTAVLADYSRSRWR